MAKFLISLNQRGDCGPPVALQNLQLLNLSEFDPDTRSLKTPRGVPYFRTPERSEYPLELSKGYGNMTFSDLSDPTHHEKLKTCHYIMKENLKPDFDFCTTRAVLLRTLPRITEKLVATKFKNCIYLKIQKSYDLPDKRSYYQLKLRQHLFVNKPGAKPNDNEPVDQRDQVYGTFSATLGELKLLYSLELPGVDNDKELGDLDNPEVLKQIKISLARGYTKSNKFRDDHWIRNFRSSRWLGQAHFAGIENIKVALMDENGCVKLPIETYSISELNKIKGDVLNNNIQLIHKLLMEIKTVMANEDSPYSAYVFHLINGEVFYERVEGVNKYSFLDEDYIDYVNAVNS